ncbi:uncharacterized protein LOC116344999 isoform X2 [Contarinia nasturtii]|uniref:uncharacterized protein LOC116344999 isoform X2 n=1 Tax=Contarinia nasturtii TaxID=265458 RepID=UPI0012D3BAA3|nr:uncharacterized protein LOC116344999 isoform X2 [Contarinia nasturtii]
MDENHAKVHNKVKHQQGVASLHENLTEATSPTKTTTTTPAPTTSIVIVQAQSNDDERPESPTSSRNVNSKNVQMSGVSNTEACEKSSSSKENVENVIRNENADDKLALFHKSSAANVAKYSPKLSPHKLQAKSMSDPPTSPAQRSVRSRSSNEKSPRQKRSKSESRRRRERKLIAAGEMEVRQANETLMRYLKQCSEVNDASLSGELEIDKNLDDRYHRKIQSQRERNNGHRSSDASIGITGGGGKKSLSTFTMRAASFARERIPSSGLSNILQELTADIIPNHDEIYNPFTPVVSPTEGPRTDKMFIQTPRGFRSASDNNFLKSSANVDSECGRPLITNDAASLSCFVQRIWILLANISHGLLAGLALAHILFIGTTTPKDLLSGSIKSYLSSTEIYTNTFYCLAILCLVSVWDRMDICRCTVLSANESISFRWIIVVMIYMATIILCLSSESFDKRFYVLSNENTNNTSTSTMDMVHNQIVNIWSSLSLARSIGAIIGWLIIGLKEPMEDQLYNQLVEMEGYKVSNN